MSLHLDPSYRDMLDAERDVVMDRRDDHAPAACDVFFDLYSGFGGPVYCERPAGHAGPHLALTRDIDLADLLEQHARWDAEDRERRVLRHYRTSTQPSRPAHNDDDPAFERRVA